MNRRTILAFLVIAMVELAIVGSAAAEALTDATGQWEYELDDGGAVITGYTQVLTGDVTIPGMVDDYPVTGIGDNAFVWCAQLTSLTIPEGVTHIGDYAFDGCYELTRICLPASVTSINDYAFDIRAGEHGEIALIMLSAIEVAPENPVYASLDGVLMDRKAGMLYMYPPNKAGVDYAVPEGIVSIKAGAFRAGSAEQVILPDSLVSIGEEAFMYSALTEIAIPAHVTRIGEGAFTSGNLTSIEVAPENTVYASLDGVLFNHSASMLVAYPCGKEGEDYTVPDGTVSIEAMAFRRCKNLTQVVLPASLTAIGEDAFYGCEQLTLTLTKESVAEQYAKDSGIAYTIAE